MRLKGDDGKWHKKTGYLGWQKPKANSVDIRIRAVPANPDAHHPVRIEAVLLKLGEAFIGCKGPTLFA